MTELYLHVGTGKTGTTALQKFLLFHQEYLRDMGVVLPLVGRQPKGDGCAYHKVACSLRSKYPRHTAPECSIEEYMDKIFDQTQGADRVLLSSEFFGPLNPSALHRLSAATKRFEAVKIIIYLRRQDEHAISFYSQKIKGGDCYGFDECVASDRSWFDLCEKWGSVFGRENILVRIYDRVRFVGGVESDFLSIFGIPMPPAGRGSERENVTLPLDAIEIKKLLNELFGGLRGSKDNARYLNALTAYWQDRPLRADERVHRFRPGQRSDLLERYREDNARVAANYLGANETDLFEWSEAEFRGFETYRGVSPETVADMLDFLRQHDDELAVKLVDAFLDAVSSGEEVRQRAVSELGAGVARSGVHALVIDRVVKMPLEKQARYFQTMGGGSRPASVARLVAGYHAYGLAGRAVSSLQLWLARQVGQWISGTP